MGAVENEARMEELDQRRHPESLDDAATWLRRDWTLERPKDACLQGLYTNVTHDRSFAPGLRRSKWGRAG